MDLIGEVKRLRLDVLSVQASAALTGFGIPHLVLKGPSTALWLYDPPRSYNDVDILIPLSRVRDATDALAQAGVATPAAGRVGEEAEHSYLLRSAEGFELDLHISLPTVPPAGDRIWEVLEPHIELLNLGVGSVPALDEPGRCLVVALHALNSARQIPQPARDLELAHERASLAAWEGALEIAAELGVSDLFEAGRDFDRDAEDLHTKSPRSYLFAVGAPNSAVALERLAETPWRRRPVAFLRELFPSAGFMRRAYPDVTTTRLGLMRAYLYRWRRISVNLPRSARIWWGARHRRG